MTIDKTKDFNGNNLIIVNFNSLNEVVNFIKNTKSNFQPVHVIEHNHGVKTLDEALSLCNEKNLSNIKEILKLKNNLDDILPNYNAKRKVEYCMYGHKYNLSRVLTGNPNCMEKFIPVEKQKLVKVHYDLAASAKDSVNIIRNKGLVTLSMLDLLKKYNYRTILTLFNIVCLDNNYIYIRYNFDKNNYDTLYYPMCHSGFNRLILREIINRLTNSNALAMYPGYGYNSKLIKIGKNDIHISYDVTTLYKEGANHDIIDKNSLIDRFDGEDNLTHDMQIFLKNINFNKFDLDNKKIEYNSVSKKFELKR